jgi:general secretion pathway protein G
MMKSRKQAGFTLVELMLALVVIGILTSIAYSSYRDAIDRFRISTAVTDILTIEAILERSFTEKFAYPANLSTFNIPNDPWGNAYGYLNMALTIGNGAKRKDHGNVPINSDFDLYSSGPDGSSQPSLTAAVSRDDIVRANNGGFVGETTDY